MQKHLPNLLTIARFPLTILFISLHVHGWIYVGMGAAVACCVTDWLDGRLARRWNATSELGKNLDPYADKFACWGILFVVLSDYGVTIVLIVTLVITILYDLSGGVLRWKFGRKNIPTNTHAKRKTAALMTGLLILYINTQIDLWFVYVLGALSLMLACLLTILATLGYLRAYGFGFTKRWPFSLL